MLGILRTSCATAAILTTSSSVVFAQSSVPLPPITVETIRPADTTQSADWASRAGSLTVPNTAQATGQIERTPGGVEIVPDTQFKNTPANTIKDVVGWVPGVIAQPKSNIDNRVSIRGSGLTR